MRNFLSSTSPTSARSLPHCTRSLHTSPSLTSSCGVHSPPRPVSLVSKAAFTNNQLSPRSSILLSPPPAFSFPPPPEALRSSRTNEQRTPARLVCRERSQAAHPLTAAHLASRGRLASPCPRPPAPAIAALGRSNGGSGVAAAGVLVERDAEYLSLLVVAVLLSCWCWERRRGSKGVPGDLLGEGPSGEGGYIVTSTFLARPHTHTHARTRNQVRGVGRV